MGSGNSKPTEHVFYGETPVRFSNDLVESLQSSSETDSTREKTLELHIQSRVESELQRLQQRESQILNDLEEKLTAEDKKHGSAEKNPGRKKVQAELDALRQRLNGIPKVHELDKDVEKARDDVIKCLRSHDRTPLDCHREVDEFKAQTRRLERQFVVRTVGRDFPAGH
ncbi:uncharacterized protein LAJ45_04306 [Morchella importuna]|uniref:uncharacterized protein n=1 Tax=Morchella importuna TaxID=1174673 RepID=UPI001E8D3FD2|nr:uncharacterized protein LAJ45_04306 [Morchella importuna]KAH8151684.1 hypothetical protein LAJ45_04306 [Morchella importuna]